MLKKHSTILLLSILVCCQNTSTRNIGNSVVDPTNNENSVNISSNSPVKSQTDPSKIENNQKGYKQLLSIYNAYKDKVEKLEYIDDDWAVKINKKWFYWANGRLLPKEERLNWENFAPYPFYNYPKDLPPIRVLNEEDKKHLSHRLENNKKSPPRRHSGIYNEIWRVYDRNTSWERVKTFYFLGISTEIHREILEDLALIEEEILEKSKTDYELKAFIQTLKSIHAYNFRYIDGTRSLSYHSYGAALDFVPKK